MSQRLPQQFIDDLLARLDIVEVVGARLALTRAGHEYKARCPFHQEKTPSFTVSPQKQFYHCFGCGEHGSAIGFVMAYDGVDFRQAVEQLAAEAGLPLPQDGTQPSAGRPRATPPPSHALYQWQDYASRYFQRQLRQHPQAPRAVDYLKSRGLSGEVAARYQVGFAPPGWSNLAESVEPAQRAELARAGLLTGNKRGDYYDRFRDRIMFPILDVRGRTVAFGGRTLGQDSAKYLNSPETAIFHKGQELYGLYQTLQQDRQPQRLIVVEGYMDVIALAQFGINNAVASLGTAVTREQLQKMLRIAPEVIFCFDGDEAGHRAARRALATALPQMRDGRQIGFAFLPQGEDPDSLVRRAGAAGFRAQLDQALPLSDWLFQTLEQQTNLNTLDGRARLLELAREPLAQLPAGALRQLIVNQLANRARVSVSDVQRLMQTGHLPGRRQPPTGKPDDRTRRAATVPLHPLARQALRLLLNEPALALGPPSPADLLPSGELLTLADIPGARLLRELLTSLAQPGAPSLAAVVERYRGTDDQNRLEAAMAGETLVGEPEALRQDFIAALQRLTEEARRQRLRALRALPSRSSDEEAEFSALLRNPPVTHGVKRR